MDQPHSPHKTHTAVPHPHKQPPLPPVVSAPHTPTLNTHSTHPGGTGPYADATWVQKGALVGALAVIALGTGGIKPNVSAFGADQFDEKDPQDKREKESFFNWFYLAINIGR